MSEPTMQKTDGKAIGSLVCGILGLFCIPVIPAVIAVILGHLSLNTINRSEGRLGGRGLAVGGLVCGYFGLVVGLLITVGMVAAVTMPALAVSSEKARRTHCASNLKQIGLACLMYASDNKGCFPPDLATLADQEVLLPGKVYNCPGNSDLRPPASAVDIRNGQAGYQYFGSGIRDDNAQAMQVIIAADKDGNHGDFPWVNALFADGHVEGAPGTSIREVAARKGWIIPGTKPARTEPFPSFP